jgi:hypothetical protein
MSSLVVWLLAMAGSIADPEALVVSLGAARYEDREAASRALQEMGDAAVPALRKAAGSDDPEVAQRAAVILRLLLSGESTGGPPGMAEAIREIRKADPDKAATLVVKHVRNPALAPLLARNALDVAGEGASALEFRTRLRARLLPALVDQAFSGEEKAAVSNLLRIARCGVPELYVPAADACWLAGLMDTTDTAGDMPGDAALAAMFAFHRGEYAAFALQAASLPDPAEAALAAVLVGDWSRLPETAFWRTELQSPQDRAETPLALARLAGDTNAVEQATGDVLARARADTSRDDLWFPLENLLVNDAWSALPEFFARARLPEYEAECAHRLYCPDPLARVVASALDAILRTEERENYFVNASLFLTGLYPGVRDPLLHGYLDGPDKAPVRSPAPDWNGHRFRAQQALARAPRNADALLLLGWAESNLGRPEEAEKQRRLAGWSLLSGGELTTPLSGVEMFEHRDHPYWRAAIDQIIRLMRGRENVHATAEHVYAVALEGGDLPAAIARLEMYRLRMLSRRHGYLQTTIPYFHHARRLVELRLRLAMSRGDDAAVRVIFETGLDPLLHDAEGVFRRLVPLCGHDRAAEFAAAAFDLMAGRLAAFPEAQQARNQTAWLAALARVRLREALALLDRTEEAGVPLDPGSRDTRAELLFQSGRPEEAVREAERNAREAPGNVYLQRQLERIKRGDPLTPVPDAGPPGG